MRRRPIWSHSRRLLALAALLTLLLGLAPGPGVPPPAAAAAPGPSGEAMPTGDLPDFRLVQAEDFTRDLAVGQWPGPYDAGWDAYGDGWPDTAGQGGTNSGYAPSRVVSVRDGMLDYYLHTENGRTLAAALLPTQANHLYGRVSVRLRADAVPGYKTAFLYWPNSGVWPRDGEIDYPEGNLTGTVDAFMHRQWGTWGGDQDWYGTSARYPDWHTYTIEWKPGSVEFFLDGRSIGRSTNQVPNTPMHYVLQAERCLDGCAAPSTAAGHLQVDWISVWDYAPGTVGSTTPPPSTPPFTPSEAPGSLALEQPAAVDRGIVARGQVLGATARYRNVGGQPIAVTYAALSLRGPNGERLDLSSAIGATVTILPGAALTLGGTVTIPAGAAIGTWGVVSTWRDASGTWNESARTPFTVAAVPNFRLTVGMTSGGTVADVATGSYSAGSILNARAVPNDGYVFTGWRIDGVDRGWANPQSIAIGRDHTLTATFAPRAQFGDLPEQAAVSRAIEELAARGVIRGCDQAAGLFCPNDTTLRVQMAALITRAMGWGGADPVNPFTDRDGVDDELWRAVAILADWGVVRGRGDGTYGTADPVLNVQVVSFVTRAMVAEGYWQPQPDDGTIYPNVPSESGHRQDLATFVHYAGPVFGAEGVTLPYPGWDQPSTRAQFSVIFWQALNSYFSDARLPG